MGAYIAKSSDPTLNHPAVKAYRDVFRLCPNAGFRKDIIVTVDHFNNLELFKKVVTQWKKEKRHPFRIGGLLSEYERQAHK